MTSERRLTSFFACLLPVFTDGISLLLTSPRSRETETRASTFFTFCCPLGARFRPRLTCLLFILSHRFDRYAECDTSEYGQTGPDPHGGLFRESCLASLFSFALQSSADPILPSFLPFLTFLQPTSKPGPGYRLSSLPPLYLIPFLSHHRAPQLPSSPLIPLLTPPPFLL